MPASQATQIRCMSVGLLLLAWRSALPSAPLSPCLHDPAWGCTVRNPATGIRMASSCPLGACPFHNSPRSVCCRGWSCGWDRSAALGSGWGGGGAGRQRKGGQRRLSMRGAGGYRWAEREGGEGGGRGRRRGGREGGGGGGGEGRRRRGRWVHGVVAVELVSARSLLAWSCSGAMKALCSRHAPFFLHTQSHNVVHVVGSLAVPYTPLTLATRCRRV